MITLSTNNSGFTLVEVMVAMVIVLVGLMGLLQSVNIVNETNLRNQLRDEAVQVGERVMNDLMTASPSATSFDNYSAKIPSNLRGVSKKYLVKATRLGIGGASSKEVRVRVVWVYRGVSSVQLLSAMKTN